jgi:hypothetical protein
MPYLRVVPRDLFNESKLLKCLGQLALLVHQGQDNGRLQIRHRRARAGFLIDQDESSGDLVCSNLIVKVKDGDLLRLGSSYNSKAPYPLHFEARDESGPVFNDDGSFSDEFRRLIGI